MFDKLIESTKAKKKNRSGFFVTTATIWILVLSTVIVAGIFAFDGRLSDYERAVMIIPPPPPPPPPPPGKTHARDTEQTQPTTGIVATPTPPDGIKPAEVRPPTSGPINLNGESDGGSINGVPGGVPHGVEGGVPFGVKDGILSAAPPPPRPPDPPKAQPEAPAQQPAVIRQTSVMLQGAAIKRVEPSYPHMARTARIQGAVIIEVTINEAGAVESVRAISGHPLLREESLNAARAWRWNPTVLNGRAIKVIGTITFNFRL